MKIGYPCINRTIDCKSGRTFRLKSYSETRLVATVKNNLDCLLRILQFNFDHHIMFFRITSDLIPFASHPVNQFNWIDFFESSFREIGSFIRKHHMRISMHPDQFNIINARDPEVFKRTVAELEYHASVLDALQLDITAKIQVHAGAVYGDKGESMKRFAERYHQLPRTVRNRLVVENDDRLYQLSDCLNLSRETGVPVLFDSFHHSVNCSGQTLPEAMSAIAATWGPRDGLPMVDYSSQSPGGRPGNHAESIDAEDFNLFLSETRDCDFDVMLEIKDKEVSALKAMGLIGNDPRLLSAPGNNTVDRIRFSQ